MINVLIEHESALRQFVAKRVGCVHIASDILQKITEKLLKQGNVTEIENQRAYLYKAASNEVIDHYRSEERRDYYESQSAHIQMDYDDRSADKVLAASQELHLLQQALSELPLLTQKIFMLYRLDGIKQRDIAQQLDLNLSTIEKRLATAMKHLRLSLKQASNDFSSPDKKIYDNSLQETSKNKTKGKV
jgi:RNA polymerase sigma-70 factor (ECF subfamily)